MTQDIDQHEMIETKIKHLLDKEKWMFTPDEINEVVEFLNVREYGLALDTFALIFAQYSREADKETLAHVSEMATDMGIEHEDGISSLLEKHTR
jgi:hypothetical protein